MKITPLEIRQKSFEKAFRGVNKEEVNSFLLSLSHEWERMLDENKDLKINKEKLEAEVQKLREVETTLFKTLKTAEDTGASVVEQANKTAQLHLKETQINSDGMINDAKMKAKAIVDKAEAEAREILEEMNKDVKDLEENYRFVENQRDNVISQLKLLSGDVMSKVEKIKYQDNHIEDHLTKAKKMLRESEKKNDQPDEKAFGSLNDEIDRLAPPKKAEPKEENIEEMTHEEPTVEQVKQNKIPTNNPIIRKPVKVKVEAPAGGDDDLSFFDQLED